MTEPCDLWIDFNDVTPQGYAPSLLRFVRPGVDILTKMIKEEPIVVGDEEGNRARAVVTSMQGSGVIYVKIDLSTFSPGPDPE